MRMFMYVLFNKNSYQLFHKIRIGLIAHRQVEPCVFAQYAFFVTEGIKAEFAVITAHTAASNAAERHMGGGQVNNSIIYAAAAE